MDCIFDFKWIFDLMERNDFSNIQFNINVAETNNLGFARAGPPAKAPSPEVNTENGSSSPMRTAQPEDAVKMGSELRRGSGNRRRAKKRAFISVCPPKKQSSSIFPTK